MCSSCRSSVFFAALPMAARGGPAHRRPHWAIAPAGGCQCNLGQQAFRWDQHLPAMFKTAGGSSQDTLTETSINLKRCRSSKPVLFGYLDSPNSSFTSSAALPSVPSLPQL
eukprot:EG_transcript_44283